MRGIDLDEQKTWLIWPVRLLTVLVWLSTLLFGLYIIAYYLGALPRGEAAESWNVVLPDLYDPETPRATAGMAVHLALGAIILILGPVQLIGGVRRHFPQVHRWIGRLYILASVLTAAGGLAFIALRGTVGGLHMTIGFGLYGVLMLGAAIAAYLYARARKFEIHRDWAIRLFALAVASWLYRMEYGFWYAFTGGEPCAAPGHNCAFDGWFDMVMSFLFYVPNLIVAELVIRGVFRSPGPAVQAIAAIGIFAAIGLTALGSYMFADILWLPAIHQAFGGPPPR